MLARVIETALRSKLFDTVMVSTDDQEIAEMAVLHGADVPFMRSERNSDDHSTTSDVLQEVLGRFANEGKRFEHCCCLYPTAPFIQPADLIAGYELLQSGRFDVVMPVAEFSYPIWRSLARNHLGQVTLNFPENLNKRSQDLPLAYHDAGQWYWFNTEAFLQAGTLLGNSTGSIPLPGMQVQDIDTEDDWHLAEVKHSALYPS